MQAHVKIYMEYFQYGEQDFIPCESCGKRSNSVHHLTYRSKGGANKIENLCALCNVCHSRVHNDSGGREFNKELVVKHSIFMNIPFNKEPY